MLKRWLFRTFTKPSLEAATPPAPFLVVTILAVGLALASASQVTCPACDGAGTLKTARGLEAQITNIVQTDRHVPAGCCDNPIAEYTYIATIVVTNPGTSIVRGNLNINFYNPGDNPPMDGEEEVSFSNLEVEVPAGTTKTYEQTCFLRQYGPMLEKSHRAAINSDILKTEVDIPCVECSGRGTTALFEWLEGRTK
jgi:hypothetical protein